MSYFQVQKETHAHTRTHTQTVLLTVDEGCRSQGINQITKHRQKQVKGRETGGKKLNKRTVKHRPFDWGAQIHLGCTILQSGGGKIQDD